MGRVSKNFYYEPGPKPGSSGSTCLSSGGIFVHLSLQGPVGHEANVEHHEEPVNVHLPVRHKSLVELFLQTCKELTFLKSFFLASATDFVPW